MHVAVTSWRVSEWKTKRRLASAPFIQHALLPSGGDTYWACSQPMKRPLPKGYGAGR